MYFVAENRTVCAPAFRAFVGALVFLANRATTRLIVGHDRHSTECFRTR